MENIKFNKNYKKKILFSIIIPTYNCENYIATCLNSALDQKISNYEVIVVNDGSTDKTTVICNKYAEKYSNIRVIHKEKSGVSDSRNRGLDVAQGEYILFLDSDDSINKVLHQIADVIERTRCEIIALRAMVITQRDKKEIFPRGSLNTRYSPKEFIIECRKNNIQLDVNSLYTYKRSLLEQHNLRFMEDVVHEDIEFIPRVIMASNEIYVSDILYYNYFIREGSITQRKDQKKNAEDIIYICRSLKREFKKIEDEELKFWLDDLLVSYYLSAIERGHLTIQKDRELLESFSLEDINIKPRYHKKLFLILKCPWIYEIERFFINSCNRFKNIIRKSIS